MKSGAVALLSVNFIIIFCNVYAQDIPDSRVWKFATAFWQYKPMIYVKGDNPDYRDSALDAYFAQFQEEMQIRLIPESELSEADLQHHVFFFGPIRSFRNLQKYLPSLLTVSENGFSFGGRSITDSIAGILLITSDSMRAFQIGNSFAGATQFWQTFSDLSQYLVMEQFTVTQHGFLNGNAFVPDNNYNTKDIQNKELVLSRTKYYDFYIGDKVLLGSNKDSILGMEDKKLERILQILDLPQPAKRIKCFVYNDIMQKYYCSSTPGYGNPFIPAWENHSLSLGPVEHESIHILFDNSEGFISNTTFAEGIAGYYYTVVDTVKLYNDRLIMSKHPEFPMEQFITNWGVEGFSQIGYAASSHFVRFLVDTYGLPSVKQLLRKGIQDENFRQVFGCSLRALVRMWERYRDTNKITPGEMTTVTFRIVSESCAPTDTLYLAGDAAELGNWRANGVALLPRGNALWEGTIEMPSGIPIQYKITRGTWESERLLDNGTIPGNVSYLITKPETISITVKKWKDQQ